MMGYHPTMKQPKSPDVQRFNDALRSVLSVSKVDLQQMLADEKAANVGKPKPGPKPKTLASGHAVSDKD
jgi:hypothetical protein